MNICKQVEDCFKTKIDTYTEKLMQVEFSLIVDYNNLPMKQKLLDILNAFPKRDSVIIKIINEIEDIYTLSNQDADLSGYDEFADNLDKGEKLKISIHIDKITIGNIISIYCMKKFWEDICDRTITDSMRFFSDRLKNNERIYFVNYDTDEQFISKSILLANSEKDINLEEFDRKEKLERCKLSSYFYNALEFNLIPEDFEFIISPKADNICKLFNSIQVILSLVYISDYSFIKDNQLIIQINGYRKCEYTIDIFNLKKKSNYEELVKIYKWIYQDGNVTDKATLSRNIISLHCKYVNILDIDERTLSTIKSNYQLYMKDNIDQYIDLKNKLTQFIIESGQKVTDISYLLAHRLNANFIAFVSFFLTIFLTNIPLNDGVRSIFTKDITIITFIILIGSLLYLLISIDEVNKKIVRYKKSYYMLKDMYKDVLDETDIDNIFNHDKEIKDIEKEIYKSRDKVTLVWCIIIVLIFIAIDYVSGFHSIKLIFNEILNGIYSIITFIHSKL